MGGLLVEPARPRGVREHRWAPWLAVAAVCVGAFMGQLDASIVTLAFPSLEREFGAGLAAVQWVSLAYLLALVALLVPVGRWSDRAGRKLVYLYGFGVFTAASAACGLAGSLTVLVGLRVVQAVGAAMLQANSVALVSTSVPPARRRAALGIQAGAQALGLALGPTLGGLLVAWVGWRWVFWVNVPVGLLALTAGWLLLPRTRQRAAAVGADPAGMALLAVASAALLLVVSSVSGLPLPAAGVAAVVAVAGGAAAVLFWWERRAPAPLLDLRLLTVPAVGVGLLGGMAAYLVLFGPLVLFAQVLASGTQDTLRAGVVLTALPAGFGLAAVGAERLLPAGWSGRRRCVLGGLVGTAAAAALAAPAPAPGLPLPLTAALLGLLGAGLGMFIPANNSAILAVVPDTAAATMGGMVNLTRGVGTALGVAVVTLALHLTAGPVTGRTAAMAALAVAALLTAATGVVRPAPARSRSRSRSEPPTARGGQRVEPP